MVKSIKTYITNYIDPHLHKPLLTSNPHIIIGLSGGPDSVFLLHFLHSLENITLTAAHINHGWRANAKTDEQFCKTLCQTLSIPFISAHANDLELSIKPNGSKEEVGRKLRRHFFNQVQKKYTADYIALAHHQQDQQETFFLRLIRGCSLEGLIGIKPVQGPYIRPLLTTPKEKIINYLTDNKIEYVIDNTNSSDNYLRNRIRNHVIPTLNQTDPRFNQKFQTSLATLDEENRLLQNLAQQAHQQVFATNKKSIFVGDKNAFLALAKPLQKRILIDWLCKQNVPFCPSDGFLQEIIRFLSSDRGGRHQIDATWGIVKKQSKFWIEQTTKSP